MLINKVAIITGAAQGLGKAIALRYAHEGANIVIADLNEKKGNEVKKEIEALGRKALVVKTDISVISEIKKMVQKTIEEFGRVDILVNNAGIIIRCPFLEVTEDIWDKTLDINTKGSFFCAQEVAKEMVKSGKGGRIINIASFLGKVGYLYSSHAPYEASKAGVITMTKQMAIELAPYKINVNAIAPGIMQTEMTAKSRRNSSHVAEVLKEIPLGRYGVPEDIAGVAVFLASEDANYMTGTTVVVDGGWLTH